MGTTGAGCCEGGWRNPGLGKIVDAIVGTGWTALAVAGCCNGAVEEAASGPATGCPGGKSVDVEEPALEKRPYLAFFD